jgi:hypothetical protein
MAEMGLGYGSEYQLLRFLGHHRTFLEEQIHNNTKFKGALQFFDFPINNNRLSLDGEYIGIKFLLENKEIDYETIKNNWKNYWPNSSKGQHNWDAIIVHGDEYILVEAKAHLKELETNISEKAKESSIEKINKAFEETKQNFNILTNNNWFKNYYQLANRLSFVNFLHKYKIRASLLYMYFINGYEKRKMENYEMKIIENKSVRTKEEWDDKIKQEYEYRGIVNNNILDYISSIGPRQILAQIV